MKATNPCRRVLRAPRLKGAIYPDLKNVCVDSRLFRQISLVLTDRCGFDCQGCYVKDQRPETPNDLSEGEIRSLLDQGHNLGAYSLRVTGGDVFLHPYFFCAEGPDRFPLLTEADQLGFEVVVLSDGARITAEIAEELNTRKVSLLLKFWGPEELYGKLACGPDKGGASRFKECQGIHVPPGVHSAVTAGFNRSEPSRLGVQMMLLHDNIEFAPTLYQWCRENNIIPFVELKMGADPSDYLSVRAISELFESLRGIDRRYGFDWPLVAPAAGWTQCLRRYYGLVVQPTGAITACSSTSSVGNIRRGDSLAEAWASNSLRLFLERLESQNENAPFGRWNAGCVCHNILSNGDPFSDYEYMLSAPPLREPRARAK